jgi:putative ATP-binding cassette transporter
MNLLLFLLRASWRIALLAALVGGLSGAASVGLVALILRALRAPGPSGLLTAGLFAALCAVVLSTQVASHLLLSRLAKKTVSELRVGLCRQILRSPLQHLEEVGAPRLLGVLTGDVTVISRAMNGIPVIGVNLVVLSCGAVYLGMLSPRLLLGALGFGALGVATYWYSSRRAQEYVRRAQEAQDVVLRQIRELIEGIKELKMHRDRQDAFVDDLVRSEAVACESLFIGDGLYHSSVSWGRLTFFVAIGLLLFAWPRFSPTDPSTLTAFALTIMYLMSPLEQILGWVPFLAWASSSVSKIERLGLMLNRTEEEPAATVPISSWTRIDFSGVVHARRPDGQPHGFVLGPLDLSVRTGEIVFIIGGNGSGKTTLCKLLVGLYVPESGEIRLDGQRVAADNRENYRQCFSAVFDDAVVFASLWGLRPDGLDQRAREYLQQLELASTVTVTGGVLSTTALSRGQRKRLALLTAYLEDRPIYVFDEWAADQDPVFRRVFYEQLLPELKRRGKTVVAVTHDDRYFGHADRVIKLEEGHVVETSVRDRRREPSGVAE